MEFRERRRALSTFDQDAHALAASRIFVRSGLLPLARRVSAYFASDGELDPEPLTARLHQVGAELVFPVIRGHRRKAFERAKKGQALLLGRMIFRRARKGQALFLNRVGIWEPAERSAKRVLPRSISVMLVPLVAFDDTGTRLGRGGGYYDAYLAGLGSARPLLIGYAHECQKADAIPRAPWDVPLDAVVTERGVHVFSKRASRVGRVTQAS